MTQVWCKNASLSRWGDVDSRMKVSKLELNCRTVFRKRNCTEKVANYKNRLKATVILVRRKMLNLNANQPDYSLLRNFDSTRQKRRLEMAKTADGDRVKVDYYWDFVEKSSAFISSLKPSYSVDKLGKWLSWSCDFVIWKLLLHANRPVNNLPVYE